jgi:Flp pilus assembly protein TadD
LSNLAGAHAEAGDQERARTLAGEAERAARAITDPDTRSSALSGVATTHARTGDHDQAERVARTITDPGPQADALSNLARARAKAGDQEQAERVARSITDPDAQARALSELATAHARAGDRDKARELLASALALGDWPDLPVDELAGFAPDALDQLAESALLIRGD